MRRPDSIRPTRSTGGATGRGDGSRPIAPRGRFQNPVNVVDAARGRRAHWGGQRFAPFFAMNPNPKFYSRAWLIVALLWVVACLNYLDRIMITTMRGSLKEAIEMTDAQFGLLTSIFLWVYGL